MQIDGETRLIGILGDPVSHSLSPHMQNAALEAMGLNICYVPLQVKPQFLKDAVSGLKAMRFIGANVTIPHKVAVVEFLDSLDGSASAAGAVNTIVNSDGRLAGYNTDGAGFIRSLEESVKPDYHSWPALIFGAGGAARSVGMALAAKGTPKITIVNRTRATAEELKALLKKNFSSLNVDIFTMNGDYATSLALSRIIINATPLGMEGPLKQAALQVDKLSKAHVVCDLVYSRSLQETPLLLAAKEKGATTLSGLGMLLHQGAAAIHLWTGMEPPVEIMRQAIESL